MASDSNPLSLHATVAPSSCSVLPPTNNRSIHPRKVRAMWIASDTKPVHDVLMKGGAFFSFIYLLLFNANLNYLREIKAP
jgi:hypothetical protein